MTTFSLLSGKGTITTNFSRNRESIKAQILELAKRSTAEKNLVSKAAIYCMDEPNVQGDDSDNVIQTAINTMNDWYAVLNEVIAIISTDDSGDYTNFKNYPDWENQIKTIPNIVPHTIGSMQWLIGYENKAKGKEFDNVLIDLGYGAFAPGQLYVALSRCKDLEGISLAKPIKKSDVIIDEKIEELLKKRERINYLTEKKL